MHFSSWRPRAACESGIAPQRARGDSRGFTIVEVSMATFVMAFGIATSIIALQMGFRAIDVARDSTIAAQIMQSEIERLRLLPWNNTATSAKDSIVELTNSGTPEDVPLTTMFTGNEALIAKYKVQRLITPDPSRSDVRNITITVQWRSYDGRSHTRNFTTLYAQNGLYDYYYTIANVPPATVSP